MKFRHEITGQNDKKTDYDEERRGHEIAFGVAAVAAVAGFGAAMYDKDAGFVEGDNAPSPTAIVQEFDPTSIRGRDAITEGSNGELAVDLDRLPEIDQGVQPTPSILPLGSDYED